jgi:uncharacterized protein YoxC
MMTGIAALVAAVAFAVLVLYLVSTLIQIRKAAFESERFLSHLNSELPPLLKDVRLVTEQVNALAIEARDSIEHASVFLHAVGQMGEAVQQVQGLVRGQGGNVVSKLSSVFAGLQTASAVVKGRFLKSSGGNTNGAN